MVKLANILSRLNRAKILIIGDMLLDTYTIGKAKRISPEAPVAVVNVLHQEHRPGGAGNVILNLLSLGAEMIAVGRVGRDWAGQTLINALQEEGVDTGMIVCQEAYHTPVKNRVIADNQQIVRVDHEQITVLAKELELLIIEKLPRLLQGVQVVALSDYGKGFLTPPLISAVIDHALERNIPVITDPKGHDFYKYQGTTIIKPNVSEAYAAANLPSTAHLDDVAAKVLQQTQAQLLMITRSEAGISLFESSGARHDFPVHVKEVKDVTGAGDTVLAMLAYAVANRLSYQEAAQLCNVAAGLAIESVGCARISLSDLALRCFEHNMGHKVFDQDHLFVLQEVLKQKPFHLLMLSGITQLTPTLFQSIKTIVKERDRLLIYINDIDVQEVLIDILASLHEVSFIVLHVDNLKDLCHKCAPKSAYIFDALYAQLILVDWSSYLSQYQLVEEKSYESQCRLSMGMSAASGKSHS